MSGGKCSGCALLAYAGHAPWCPVLWDQVTAERDVALAAVERVRALVETYQAPGTEHTCVTDDAAACIWCVSDDLNRALDG